MGRGRAVMGLIALGLCSASAATSAAAAPLKWSAREQIVPRALNAVACPNPTLCIAVGDGGQAAISTNPTGGTAAWNTAGIDGTRRLISLACASASLCVATDNLSRAVTSTNPTGGAAAWTAATIDAGRWITAISCASPKLCVAVDRHGGVISSTNPTGGAHAWKRVQALRHGTLTSISCPSTRLCVATQATNLVLVSTQPTGGPASWRQQRVMSQPGGALDVACPTTHLCVAVARSSDLVSVQALSTSDPTGHRPWLQHDLDSFPHEGNLAGAVACQSALACAAIARSDSSPGTVWSSAHPLGGWNADPSLDDSTSAALLDIGCARTGFCIVVDGGGGAFVGS